MKVRAGVGVCGLLLLAACTPTPSVTRSVSLAEGTVLATSPAGYCVDPVASKPRKDFALLVPCAALGTGSDVPDVIGMATLQVGPPASGSILQDEIALRDFLVTEEGNNLLSQSGNGDEITIRSTQAFGNQVMVHFVDAGAPPMAGLQPEEWRGFRNVGGRLVTIGVRGLAEAPLRDGPGATLLKRILAGVKTTAQDDASETPQT